MNLSVKLILSIGIFSACILHGCRHENTIRHSHAVGLDESRVVINTKKNLIQIISDSVIAVKTDNKFLYTVNSYTGKISDIFIQPDSIGKDMLDKIKQRYRDSTIAMPANQDSIIKAEKFDKDSPVTDISGFSFNNDTFYILSAHLYITEYLGIIEGKQRKLLAMKYAFALFRTDHRFRIIDYSFINNQTDEHPRIGSFFAAGNGNYYFCNTMALAFKNAGVNQLNIYQFNGNHFTFGQTGPAAVPLTSGFLNRIHADTGKMSFSLHEMPPFIIKISNNRACYSNRYELVDVSRNKQIIGASHNYKIHALASDSLQNYFVLTEDTLSGKLRIKAFDKEAGFYDEKRIRLEENEKLIAADMDEKQLILLTEMNEQIFLKKFFF